MLTNTTHLAELQASEQKIQARVELYKGSTLGKICNCGEVLEEFTVEKTGEGKFFGFGICQKLRATLIDLYNDININEIDSLEACFGVEGDFVYPFPKFYLQEAERDEVFGVINVTAYDALYSAANHTVAELKTPIPYTIKTFAGAIAAVLGLPLVIDEAAANSFETVYLTPANFEGTETLRAALDDIAEVTQTIYYIDGNWNLYFKRIRAEQEPVLTIGKNEYIELTDNGIIQLTNIAHTTELGDNVEVGEDEEGVTQYMRNNPFLELREDIDRFITDAGVNMGGLQISQFRCDWSGNYLLEIGDKIGLVRDDNTELITYILDDNITFNGALWQVNSWAFDGSEAESPSNPVSIGEALNKTFARVDKVNQEITLLAKESDNRYSELKMTTAGLSTRIENNKSETDKKFTELEITAEGIDARIESTEATTEGLKKDISDLSLRADGFDLSFEKTTERVTALESNGVTKEELDGAIERATSDFQITANDAILSFKTEIEQNGVTKVDTTTGFKFSEDGLEITKTGAATSTLIDESGMIVSDSSGEEQLTANNEGVSARNLHATTYIFIGENSRLETYQGGRTACFWVGS